MNASDTEQCHHSVSKAAKNLTSRTVHGVTLKEYRNNRTIQFSYDDLNRLTTETWTGTPQQINYTYDAVGNLRTIADLYSSLTYSYDNQNRSTSIDNSGTPNFPVVVLGQTYDANSNRLRLTDTIATQLRGTEAYTYDTINRLTRVTQSGTGVQPKRVDMAYTPVHQLATLTRYSNLAGTALVASSSYAMVTIL